MKNLSESIAPNKEDVESREDQINRLTKQATSMRIALEDMKSREFWEPNLRQPVKNLENALKNLENELDGLNK